MRKKVCFLFQGVGPQVSEKFELLYGAISPDHFEEVALEEADYLFFTPFAPQHHAAGPDTVKVLIAGENMTPDFNACDYAISGEFLEFGDRYLRVPIYAMDPAAKGLQNRARLTKDELSTKSKFCNFIYSNSVVADPYRLEFFEALHAIKPVISAGRLRRNYNGLAEMGPDVDWGAEKRKLVRDCRFTLAIENAEQPGYITEKMTDPYLVHSIPVYWGDPLIEDEFNQDAFLNLRNFPDADTAIKTIIELDADPDRQLAMQNASVFTGNFDRVEDYLSKARDFFQAIFDQPLDTARRRPRHGWVQGMENIRRKYQTKNMWFTKGKSRNPY
ncbi:MAG: glycosyltransferase family 10 [Pseudomonadota bacterium]